jgi:hypothetical protein
MTGKKRSLHPRARTTRAQRKRIQASEDSDRALAAKLHVNVKTVAKWRRRRSTDDAPMGPRRAPWFNEAAEALIVVVRKFARLPLERELAALRRLMPDLSRSALYRCQRKWGVNRVPRRLRRTKLGGQAPAEPPLAKGGMRPTCAQGRGRRVRRRCALGYAATAVGALTATSMRAFQAQGINSSILVMG